MDVLKEDQVDVSDDTWKQITDLVFGSDTGLAKQPGADSHGGHDFVNIWTDKRKIFKGFE